MRPIRDVVSEYMTDPAELQRLMAVGAHKARATARKTLGDVYDAIGFVSLPGE